MHCAGVVAIAAAANANLPTPLRVPRRAAFFFDPLHARSSGRRSPI